MRTSLCIDYTTLRRMRNSYVHSNAMRIIAVHYYSLRSGRTYEGESCHQLACVTAIESAKYVRRDPSPSDPPYLGCLSYSLDRLLSFVRSTAPLLSSLPSDRHDHCMATTSDLQTQYRLRIISNSHRQQYQRRQHSASVHSTPFVLSSSLRLLVGLC